MTFRYSVGLFATVAYDETIPPTVLLYGLPASTVTKQ